MYAYFYMIDPKIEHVISLFIVATVLVWSLSRSGIQHYGQEFSLVDSMYHSCSLASLGGFSKSASRSDQAKILDMCIVFVGVWAVVA
jgi:hypothetical protein